MDSLAVDTASKMLDTASSLSDTAWNAAGSMQQMPMPVAANPLGMMGGSMLAGLAIGYLLFIAFFIFVVWKIFVKAGKPGWAAIVPLYNVVVMLEIVRRPLWWIILCMIPLVNFIVMFILVFDLARKFGKGKGFGLGLIFLGFIFYPVLAFGDAQYDPNA